MFDERKSSIIPGFKNKFQGFMTDIVLDQVNAPMNRKQNEAAKNQAVFFISF
jgi:hypothetical protein